jgi:hypothetical protein
MTTNTRSKPFTDAVTAWYAKFDAMKVGTAYEIAACTKNSEMFIEIAKEYIDLGNYQYEFSSDYKYFKRFTDQKL